MSTALATRRNSSRQVIPIDHANLPRYELRLQTNSQNIWQLQIWQLPSPATPRLTSPEFVACLKGVALRLLEPRLLRRLAQAQIALGRITPGKRETWPLNEELALSLGLLFRTLAPMRSIDRITQVADGIDQMSREEAGYWLGMAMHRRYPRRVLAALRLLLTES
jgi:hypothetical protein